jgi:hypothetical protein
MSKKTKNAKPLEPINVGDRVRHPDGTEGTVTATSGSKVTIGWPNDETTTWEASYLRIRGIKRVGDEANTPAPDASATPEPAPVEQAQPTPVEETPAEQTPPVEQVAAEEPSADATPVEQVATEKAAPEQPAGIEPASAKKPRMRKASTGDAKEKKLSAIDAAAKVLGEAGTPMTCPEMIEAMAKKGYWTSPGGQTPSATLYSAILREINTKGADARFVKTERGKFGRKS